MLFGLFKPTDEQEIVNQAFDKWQSENNSANESQDDFYGDDNDDSEDDSTDATGTQPSWLGWLGL